MPDHEKRIVMVSNRLPISLYKDEQNAIQVKQGAGGLVTALVPLLNRRNGLWIGWPGTTEISLEEIEKNERVFRDKIGFDISPVILSENQWEMYYNGFSNEIIWPLFHDLQSDCNFDPKYWNVYKEVNKKFAEQIIKKTGENDFIWVHDYHLILTAQELRKKGFDSKLAFFLHIPFPPLDVFLKLPWRFEFLKGLLEYDLVGFQTMRDKRNFIQCIKTLMPHIQSSKTKSMHTYTLENHSCNVSVFPISIDFNGVVEIAKGEDVAKRAWYNKEKLPHEKIIFSVDRLDVTKGITYRLRAIEHLLEKHPELHRHISFIELVQPSRIDIPIYQKLKNEIDRLVGEINSRFTNNEWVPIKYMYRTMSREELISYYQIADVCLVTPFKDGMNLVSKEYPAARIHDDGVLVLSEFAGAAAQLHHNAMLVNPYDVEGISNTLYQAIKQTKEEQNKHMSKMRESIKAHDIYWWIDSFLEAAFEQNLKSFQMIHEYLPEDKDLILK